MQTAASLLSVSNHPSVLQEVRQEVLPSPTCSPGLWGLLHTASAGSQFGNILEH